MTAFDAIVGVLRPLRLSLSDELRLHAQMAEAFDTAGLPYEREVRLSSRDRIDFMFGTVGVEVKINGSKREIYRQLERYAEHDRITALLLVINVPMGLPPTINGKPVALHSLARAWL